MRSELRGILSVVMSGLLLGGPLVGMAQAVDGVKLIDQNKALAGNVTPGDAPGFPVTISQAGSYVLASNLTVPDENTTAIDITADNVSLDLNGFTIQGPTVCSGVPAVCSPTSTGIGVDQSVFGQNPTLVNGTIRGMARGARLGAKARVEQVRAVSNRFHGIQVGEDSTVNGNTASSNGHSGILAGAGSTVNGNTVSSNGEGGILAGSYSTVIGNTARTNADFGLQLGFGTGYTHNVLGNNGLAAVFGGVSLGQNLCDGVVC